MKNPKTPEQLAKSIWPPTDYQEIANVIHEALNAERKTLAEAFDTLALPNVPKLKEKGPELYTRIAGAIRGRCT